MPFAGMWTRVGLRKHALDRGCTLAQPGKYDWTVHVRQRYGLICQMTLIICYDWLRTEEGDGLEQVAGRGDLVSMTVMRLDAGCAAARTAVTHGQVTFRRAAARRRHLLLHGRHQRVQKDRQRKADVGRSHRRIFCMHINAGDVNRSREFPLVPPVPWNSRGNWECISPGMGVGISSRQREGMRMFSLNFLVSQSSSTSTTSLLYSGSL